MTDQNDNANDTETDKKGKGYKPDKNTIWLLEDVEGIDSLAGRWLGKLHKGQVSLARIVKRLDTSKLSDKKTIVVVFLDPNEPYSKTETVAGRALPNFVESDPIPCADLYVEGEDGFGQVQVTNLINENTGRTIPGLCERISRACFYPDELGNKRPTVRAIYRPDDNSLRVSSH
ncbi:MAG TPA: hypothetical protein VHM19_22920 [Polyangiales bacterium]|jgi:hypothetical protein|nr:hypothetical protein [Polyangiales bacterium]